MVLMPPGPVTVAGGAGVTGFAGAAGFKSDGAGPGMFVGGAPLLPGGPRVGRTGGALGGHSSTRGDRARAAAAPAAPDRAAPWAATRAPTTTARARPRRNLARRQ